MQTILLERITIDELKKIISDAVKREVVDMIPPSEDSYVKGYKGLAELLKCSRTKAYSLITSGILDKAISRHGRVILINSQKALDILNK